MIVVDTSAIIAICSNESKAWLCKAALEADDHILISAGTIAELLIVASRKSLLDQVERLLTGIGPEIVAVSEASARHAAQAYRQWGKGFHPASLNFGDCFAYALAMDRNCPLLYIGNDFARTDVNSALPIEGGA